MLGLLIYGRAIYTQITQGKSCLRGLQVQRSMSRQFSLLLNHEGWVLFELSLGQQDTGGTSCPSLPHPQGSSRGFLSREASVLFWVQLHSGLRGAAMNGDVVVRGIPFIHDGPGMGEHG